MEFATDEEIGMFPNFETLDEPAPTSGEMLGAELRHNNWVGSGAVQRGVFGYGNDDFTLPGDDVLIENGWTSEGFIEELGLDPINTELARDYIGDAETPAQARQGLGVWRQRREDMQTLSQMGIGDALWTGAISGILDPILIASMVATGGWSMGARTALGTAARVGAVAGTEVGIAETIIHPDQPERTLKESVMYSAGAAMFASILGGAFKGIGNSFTLRQQKNIERAIQDVLEHEPDFVGPPRPEVPGPPKPEILDDLDTATNTHNFVSESVAELEARAKREGVDPEVLINQRRAEIDAEVAETDVAPGGNTFVLNKQGPKMRLVRNALTAFRTAAGLLTDTAIANVGNIAGRATGRSTGNVTSSMDRILGRIEQRQKVMDKYAKDFNASRISRIWGNFIGKDTIDSHFIRLRRASNGRIHGADGIERDLLPWEKAARKEIVEADRILEDEVFRMGGLHEAIKRDGKDLAGLKATRVELQKRLARAIEKNKLDKNINTTHFRAELKRLDYLEALAVRVAKGDKHATLEMMSAMNGWSDYVPQKWNIDALKKITPEEFARRLVRSKHQKYERILERDDVPDSEKGYYQSLLDNWMEDAELSRARTAHKNMIESGDGMGGIDQGMGSVKHAEAVPDELKARVLDVEQSDFEIGELLEQSYMNVYTSYGSSAVPYMLLKNKGMLSGSAEFNAFVKAAKDELELRSRGLDAKGVEELREAFKKGMEDINHMNDLFFMRQMDGVNQTGRALTSILKDYNIITKLGKVLFTNLPDIATAMFKAGGVRNMVRFYGPAIKQMRRDINHLSDDDAYTFSGLMERQAATTLSRWADADSGAHNISKWQTARNISNFLTDKFMKMTGLPHLNEINKRAAAMITEDKLFKWAVNGKISKEDLVTMKKSGWTEAKRKRLAAMHSRYPGKIDGHDFLDYGKLREAYLLDPNNKTLRADMNLADDAHSFFRQQADRIVTTPTTGDIPSTVSGGPLWQIITQFKSFTFSSTDKTLIPMLQQARNGGTPQVAYGVLLMTGMGIVQYHLKQRVLGREVNTSPQQQVYEGLIRSGAFSFLADGVAISQLLTANWFGAGNSILGLDSISSYYARSGYTQLAGPSWGALEAAWKTTSALSRRATGTPLSRPDRERMLRMVPYADVWWFRGLMENL